MSEQIRSENPVFDALEIERTISEQLSAPNDRARKEVRNQMERWLELMNDPKVRQAYAEELGDIDPEVTRKELLSIIAEPFKVTAKQLGWNPSEAPPSYDQAA